MPPGTRTTRFALVLVLASAIHAALAVGGCQRQPAVERLRMATTTSVDSSGLLAAILPAFEQAQHLRVEVLPVGSGQALALLKRGDVEMALTHDPDAEATALSAGTISDYHKIMFNDFIIVGPRDDAAGVAHASDAIDAMRRIATAGGGLFISRGDASGTHAREKILWTHAGRRPAQERLLETGQGMSGTLRVASEKHAYTLTDRATFEAFRSKLDLTLLFEGGPALLNTYAIFLRAGLPPAEHAAGMSLVNWFADGDGRALVEKFQANGRTLFNVWPPGAPRNQPTDLPNAR
jgi:tungstate transport system substrate-binding protein